MSDRLPTHTKMIIFSMPVLAICLIIFLKKDILESQYNEVKEAVTVTKGKLNTAKNTIDKRAVEQENTYNDSNSKLEKFTTDQENAKKRGEEGLIQTKSNIKADQSASVDIQKNISQQKKTEAAQNITDISGNLQTVKNATKNVSLNDKTQTILLFEKEFHSCSQHTGYIF